MVIPLIAAALTALLPKIIEKAVDKAGEVIDRTVPDKEAAAAAKRELEAAKNDQDFQRDMAQLATNLAEANSGKLFIAGWRPAIGWIGAISLALIYWPKAIFLSAMWVTQAYLVLRHAPDLATAVLPAYPDLGLTDLIGLLGSLLGMGAMRTAEKMTNTEGNR